MLLAVTLMSNSRMFASGWVMLVLDLNSLLKL